MPEKVNLAEKFGQFTDTWSPRIVGEINNCHVKLAKIEGEFVWHHHDHEDEMFLVIRGHMVMKFRDKKVVLNVGEFIIVPKGVEHLPVADQICEIMLFEPKGTLNTGNVENERTVKDLEEI